MINDYEKALNTIISFIPRVGVKALSNEIELITSALERLEVLENENLELKERANSYRKGNQGYCKKVIELEEENEKLLINKNFAQAVALKYKKVIELLKNYIEYCTFGAEVTFDTFVTSQCSDEEYDLLKEVLEYE